MEKRRPLRRPPNDHNFRIALDACRNRRRFSPGHLDRNEGSLLLSSGIGDPLKATVKVLAGLPRKQD